MSISVRKIFYFIILLAFAVTTAVVLLYKHINLNDYRQHLEQQLSASLGQPVEIGRGKLTFRNGLAIDLRDLRIGKEKTPLAEIPRLTATLKIKPLFDGQIILDQVLIDNPSLQLWLPIENRPARGTTHKIFDALGIRILTIHNANLRIHLHQASGGKQVFQINDFNAVLKGWQPNRTARLVISGQLKQRGKPANFILNFSLPTSPNPESWRKEHLDYQLTLQDLSTKDIPKPPGNNLPATITLRAELSGVPAEGAVLFAEVRSSDDRQKFVELAGQWTSTAEQESLNQLTGSLLGVPVKGEVLLLRQPGKNVLAGRLGTGRFKLNRETLGLWRVLGANQLLSGELDRLALIVDDEWPAEEKVPGLPRVGLQFSLSELEWNKPELRQLKNVSLNLSLKHQELQIDTGQATFGGQTVSFAGKIGHLTSAPRLDLKINSTPDLGKLDQQLQLPESWHLAGAVPTQLHLSGPLLQPDFQLKADLSKSRLVLGQLLQKSPTQTGSLSLAGRIDREQLHLDQLLLKFADFRLSAHGSFPWRARGKNFQLDLDPFELSPLQTLSPLLGKFKLRGKLSAALEAQDAALHGTVRMDAVGCHFFNIVGDLNQATGAFSFDPEGLSFNNLALQLGQSPLVLNGTMTSWTDPQLTLDLKGDKVRAQDLIFPNRKLTLYDLDGHLRINRNGIFFEPVNVRLETNTTATVTGKVEDFENPQTILNIDAEKADILQVINLFHGPHKQEPKPHHGEHKPTIITAKAARGSLGGLQFSNAEGLIKDNAGVFTLYPLKFQTEGGYCLARVEFDRNLEHGLLKVSGHAENVDATILHQDLFKQRGLIKGELRGDFYVEGSPENGNFWKSAMGGIHLQVKNGTLRKFRGLANVFSILNVSQLFAFKLPDIDKEGMPFTLLEGSMKIENGWMNTEDTHIVSEAMNLSLVGKQNLVTDQLDYLLGVMPLRTVDKVVTSIPIAGWVLAGKDKALLTAYFKIEGSSNAPKVTPVPVDSISDTVFGIIKRTFGLPGKLVKDIGTLFKGTPKKLEPSK